METDLLAEKPKSKSAELLDFYQKVRARTEELFEPLSIEDHLAQPRLDTSPPKWHLGHTTWFFENFVLKGFDTDYQEFNPQFGYLFNSYYNNVGERVVRDARGFLTRPSLEKIYAFRKYVDGKMADFLANENVEKRALELIQLGLNHEQQHQELFLTDFKYILSVQPFYPIYSSNFQEFEAVEIEQNWQTVSEGLYEIGYRGNDFHFDNELGRHKVYLQEYKISNRLITNGEWLKFIEAGGYENFNLWHADGWTWVQEDKISHPLYWENKNNEWHRFTLAGLEKVNPFEPVCHISFYEAFAFAEWKGCRLPTEAEWEVASELFNWGECWEWTNSAYLAYPGFAKEPGAVGEYNGKFMVNQMVLRGASTATPKGHSRKTYRNFFEPQLRWQFTGLRLAKD